MKTPSCNFSPLLNIILMLLVGLSFSPGFNSGYIDYDQTVANYEKGGFAMKELADIHSQVTKDSWQSTGLDGSVVKRADVEFDSSYQPYVTVEFTNEGAKLCEEVTARNIGKPLAIFIGDELISAPIVLESINGGRVMISGEFTYKEANEMKTIINYGAESP